MHLGSPDGIGLGRNFVSGLNVILHHGAELILLFFAAGDRCTPGPELLTSWRRYGTATRE
jgi:hypothetical protein